MRASHGDRILDGSSLQAVDFTAARTGTACADCGETCEGGPLLEAVASLVKSMAGATIWAVLPDISVTNSAVLGAESDAS